MCCESRPASWIIGFGSTSGPFDGQRPCGWELVDATPSPHSKEIHRRARFRAILFLNPHPLIPDCIGIEGGCEGMPNRKPVSSGYGLRTEFRELRVSRHDDPKARVKFACIENPDS